MKQIFVLSVVLALAACSPKTATLAEAAVDSCIPAGYDSVKLDALKAAEFEIANEAARQAFAKAITACLASPDPKLRDGIAYEALTHMLRGKQLSTEAMRALLVDLQARLDAPMGQEFERSFAALALSEVARADRVEAFLAVQELVTLIVKSQSYLANVDDYRGFDEKEGWRHGVAHGSDLLMQLALNPRLDKDAFGLIIVGVGVQAAPKGHSYIYGESERLARPILFAARRGAMTEEQWSAWLVQIATPPAESAEKMFASSDGLAWRHNTTAFLQALYVNVLLGADKADDVMLPGLEAALKAMP